MTARKRTTDDGGKVTADEYFAMVPEWILFADISPQAVRLYAVLHRIANDVTSKGHAKRSTLAERLRRRSGDTWVGVDVKTVDRATAELEAIGAIEVTEQFDDAGDRRENLYKVITRRPADTIEPAVDDPGGGDIHDATQGQPCPDGGDIHDATVASQMSQQGNQSPLTRALESEGDDASRVTSASRTRPEAEDRPDRGAQLVAEIAGLLGHPYLVEQLYLGEDAGGRHTLGTHLAALEASGWPTVDLVVEIASGITVDSEYFSLVAVLLTRARALDPRPYVAQPPGDSTGITVAEHVLHRQLDAAHRHGETLAGAGLPPHLIRTELEHVYDHEALHAALTGAGLPPQAEPASRRTA